MAVLISLGVFCGIGLVFAGIYLATQGTTATAERLASVTNEDVGTTLLPTEKKDETSFFQRFFTDIGNWYQDTFKSDEKEVKQSVSRTKALLSEAGWRGANATAIFTGVTIVAAAGGAAVMAAVAAGAGLGEKSASLAVVGVCMGLFIPRMFVNRKVTKRQEIITKTTPDVIDMLILCVESGLGLNTAIKRVADERCKLEEDVMGMELRQMTYELQAGRTREEAFRDLADRNGVEELSSLAAFMIQSDKLGTNVADALRIYAEESRIARRQRAQEMANKAAVKLLFPLVLFIFPTMFLVILGPAMLLLRENLPK